MPDHFLILLLASCPLFNLLWSNASANDESDGTTMNIRQCEALFCWNKKKNTQQIKMRAQRAWCVRTITSNFSCLLKAVKRFSMRPRRNRFGNSDIMYMVFSIRRCFSCEFYSTGNKKKRLRISAVAYSVYMSDFVFTVSGCACAHW